MNLEFRLPYSQGVSEVNVNHLRVSILSPCLRGAVCVSEKALRPWGSEVVFSSSPFWCLRDPGRGQKRAEYRFA